MQAFRLALGIAAIVLGSNGVQAAQPKYRLQLLHEGPQATFFSANLMNNRGEVLGSGLLGDDTWRKLLYKDGRITALDNLSDFGPSDMNDRGDMAGARFEGPRGYYPALYRDGRFIDLGASLGNVRGSALALNNRGHAVGYYVTQNEDLLQFYYDGTSVRTLDFEYGFFDINDRDVLLNADGFMLDHGRIERIPRLGEEYGPRMAVALNNLGQAVGHSQRKDDINRYAAWIYSQGTLTNLGSLGGGSAAATDINDKGWVVGQAINQLGDYDAFLYLDGAMHNLEDLVVSKDGHWDFESARQINDRGQVLVNGLYNGFQGYGAAILTPVPEMQAGVLMFAGLGAVGAVVRRRQRPGRTP